MTVEPSLKLDIPDDVAMQAAVGRIALRHGQLDHVLRLTVKTIQSMDFKSAMRATKNQGSYQLRDRIRKLAMKKLGEGDAMVQLDVLLERAREVTEKRNRTVHNVWARKSDGELVIRDDSSTINTLPTLEQLESLADDTARIVSDLNSARLKGFLHEALAAL
jgi:hypothetical protein